jgi:RNA polymerase sigma-70 factor (ECF subfamily)
MPIVTWAQAAAECHVTGADSTLSSAVTPAAERPAEPQIAKRDLQRADVDALIGRDYIGLRTLLFRRTGDPHVAADLLNDAICTALEKYNAGQIARPDQIAGYVFQVAMNHLRNHRRSMHERADRRVSSEVIDTLCADDAPDDLDRDSRVIDRVIRIMRSMSSARDRTILVRFYLDEAGKDEICRELNLTPAQFASVLHRARLRLKDLLEAEGLNGTDMFSWVLF